MKIQQPKQVRNRRSSQQIDCSCSGGNGKSAHGPFGRQEVFNTDNGICRVDDTTKKGPLEFRDPDPMPKHVPSSCDWIVDWAYAKFINSASIVRSFYYAVRSILRILRWGLVTYETYHNRRLYCSTCDDYYVDHDEQRVYCGYDPIGCGCPKFVDLFVKLRLSGYSCPKGLFDTGRNIQPPEIRGEVECQKPSGKVEMLETKATSV